MPSTSSSRVVPTPPIGAPPPHHPAHRPATFSSSSSGTSAASSKSLAPTVMNDGTNYRFPPPPHLGQSVERILTADGETVPAPEGLCGSLETDRNSLSSLSQSASPIPPSAPSPPVTDGTLSGTPAIPEPPLEGSFARPEPHHEDSFGRDTTPSTNHDKAPTKGPILDPHPPAHPHRHPPLAHLRAAAAAHSSVSGSSSAPRASTTSDARKTAVATTAVVAGPVQRDGQGDAPPAGLGPGKIEHHRVEDSVALQEKYDVGRKLGQGSFGTVMLLTDRHHSNPRSYACKSLKKKKGSRASYEQQEREVAIMKIIKHPHIVQLYEVYETPRKFFLVMEHCEGGELVENIRVKKWTSEEDARVIIRRIAEAVAYLHDRGIVHRDLKPENILLSLENPHDHLNVKVSDFGLATWVDKCSMMEHMVGTPLYMAPEIIHDLPYSAQCDIWSIGIVMYLILSGCKREVERSLIGMVSSGKIEYPNEIWRDVSPGAKSLCDSMLRFDPAKRISAREILLHPWTKGPLGDFLHAGLLTTTNVLDLMRNFNSHRRLRKTLNVVRAAVRLCRLARVKLKLNTRVAGPQSLHHHPHVLHQHPHHHLHHTPHKPGGDAGGGGGRKLGSQSLAGGGGVGPTTERTGPAARAIHLTPVHNGGGGSIGTRNGGPRSEVGGSGGSAVAMETAWNRFGAGSGSPAVTAGVFAAVGGGGSGGARTRSVLSSDSDGSSLASLRNLSRKSSSAQQLAAAAAGIPGGGIGMGAAVPPRATSKHAGTSSAAGVGKGAGREAMDTGHGSRRRSLSIAAKTAGVGTTNNNNNGSSNSNSNGGLPAHGQQPLSCLPSAGGPHHHGPYQHHTHRGLPPATAVAAPLSSRRASFALVELATARSDEH
ncbi:kinase-like domain-containing protein [Zopfochytrium polystomum]|nr:kinase-like domain-containing protein [Zopfochytrium polystomum]